MIGLEFAMQVYNCVLLDVHTCSYRKWGKEMKGRGEGRVLLLLLLLLLLLILTVVWPCMSLQTLEPLTAGHNEYV